MAKLIAPLALSGALFFRIGSIATPFKSQLRFCSKSPGSVGLRISEQLMEFGPSRGKLQFAAASRVKKAEYAAKLRIEARLRRTHPRKEIATM
jgi:hypothetical protein